MTDRDPIDRLRSSRPEWPLPSGALRARVVAVPVRTAPIGWTDRAWYSRTWRLGMTAAAVLLVAVDLWGVPGTVPAPAVAHEDTEKQAIEELARSAGLPDDIAASVAQRSLMRSGAPTLERAALITGGDR